ncbi:MAG: hypothetical protein ACOCQ5_05315 [Halanaerobiales bacterium]
MLTIKCARCKTKLFKYEKIGKGKVLRCYEEKIQRFYEGEVKEEKLVCRNCGNEIGDIEENKFSRYVKMNSDTFTYTGTKISK